MNLTQLSHKILNYIHKIVLYIFLVIFFPNHLLVSQMKNDKLNNKLSKADELFEHKNYLRAIPIYKDLLKKEPDNKYVQVHLAVCYLNTNQSRTEPIKLLEELTKDEKGDMENWYYLGSAYHLNGQIDKAIAAFEKYISLKPKKSDIEKAKRKIEQCQNAKKLMSNPIRVTFTNLGPDINSPDPDYYPYVNDNETFLVFTSRRKENVGGNIIEIDGYRPSDIWFSKVENGKWIKAFNAGKTINTNYDEQAVSLSTDGKQMIVYFDNIKQYGDLYTSEQTSNGNFTKIKRMHPLISNPKTIETSGSFTPDGNTFFFARRNSIDDQSDIYMIRKLPNGQWGIPQKLPEQINTPYNEDFPYIAADGITLYFSSEGHNSMGGYDLFKSTWNPDENTWSPAENLGYPINTTSDDRSICITPDNRVGYISAFRPNGIGDLDIYRIRFEDNDQIIRIITGKIFLNDTTHEATDIPIIIIANNKKTQEERQFIPNSKTAKYVMALEAGEYTITISAEGYQDYIEDITISDIGKIQIEKNKDFILKKKE